MTTPTDSYIRLITQNRFVEQVSAVMHGLEQTVWFADSACSYCTKTKLLWLDQRTREAVMVSKTLVFRNGRLVRVLKFDWLCEARPVLGTHAYVLHHLA